MKVPLHLANLPLFTMSWPVLLTKADISVVIGSGIVNERTTRPLRFGTVTVDAMARCPDPSFSLRSTRPAVIFILKPCFSITAGLMLVLVHSRGRSRKTNRLPSAISTIIRRPFLVIASSPYLSAKLS